MFLSDDQQELVAYFFENVVASYREYLKIKKSGLFGRSRDKRAAANVAIELYHFREHLPETIRPKCESIILKCPDYALVRDIANVSKHGKINRHKDSQINSFDQISEAIINIEYKDENGPYFYSEKTVQIKLNNGSKREILGVLTNVMNFWQEYLKSIDIISKSHLIDWSVDKHEPKSREECEGTSIGFDIASGLRFGATIVFLKYNYDTCKIESVDLRGHKATMKFYKLPEIAVSLTNEKTGVTKDFSIHLSRSEYSHLSKLNDEKEQMEYLNSLPNVRKAVFEKLAEFESEAINNQVTDGY